jgi:hypothetical protein
MLAWSVSSHSTPPHQPYVPGAMTVRQDITVVQTALGDVLVKIDAQGFDDRVIRGGTATLRKARVCIVEINLDRLYQDQGTFRDMFLLMDGLGYSYRGNLDQSYAPDGHVAFIDAVFVR